MPSADAAALVQETRKLTLLNLAGNVIRDDYVTFLRDVCCDDLRGTVIKLVV